MEQSSLCTPTTEPVFRSPRAATAEAYGPRPCALLHEKPLRWAACAPHSVSSFFFRARFPVWLQPSHPGSCWDLLVASPNKSFLFLTLTVPGGYVVLPTTQSSINFLSWIVFQEVYHIFYYWWILLFCVPHGVWQNECWMNYYYHYIISSRSSIKRSVKGWTCWIHFLKTPFIPTETSKSLLK